ncbi:MAG: 6,7-dimethyl-8-ribityllumazine synthase [Microthrixaceae bacterium]
MNVIEGNLDGSGLRIGIVAGRFNDLITTRLLEGARRRPGAPGTSEDDITVVMVPGASRSPSPPAAAPTPVRSTRSSPLGRSSRAPPTTTSTWPGRPPPASPAWPPTPACR